MLVRREPCQQALPGGEGDPHVVHRQLHVLDQCIEIGIGQMHAFVDHSHVVALADARAARDLAEEDCLLAFEVIDADIVELCLDLGFSK